MSGNSPHLVIEVMPKCSINYEVICTMVATGVCKRIVGSVFCNRFFCANVICNILQTFCFSMIKKFVRTDILFSNDILEYNRPYLPNYCQF